ncbi:MAG: CoB--CoM heterodisulfide reductase iron-sulfur subunit A family protein [Spirochaetales bacterium]|nr:MAG: CoB--CoM heterodisulfide reductase iron-sulfur subunit A family protein [Spirochaetales bacterium]
MSKFLVLGAGIAGCTSAAELAKKGHEVDLLEQSPAPGGSVLSYCCKATESCVRCGVCVAHAAIQETLAHPKIRLQTGITVKTGTNNGKKVTLQTERRNPFIDLKLCVSCNLCAELCPEKCIYSYSRGGLTFYAVEYSACRLHKGRTCTVCADACPTKAITADGAHTKETFTADAALVATGHKPFAAEKKPRYGYRRLSSVFTGLEAEEILKTRFYLTKPDERVAFIQCVGSRDPEIGRNYCSAVCCAYALRMANQLAYRNKGADITVYYIDLQNFDKAFPALIADITKQGVKLERGLPFKIDLSPDNTLELLLPGAGDGPSRAEYDAVVLSVGLGPHEEIRDLAVSLGLAEDEFGFIAGPGGNILTAGTCREPQSITDTMAQAKAAVLDILRKNGRSDNG